MNGSTAERISLEMQGVAQTMSRAVSSGVTGWKMATLAALLPILGLLLVGTLVLTRQVLRMLTDAMPTAPRRFILRIAGRAARPLPSLGRVARALSWTFLFSSAAVLLLLPYSINPFLARSAGSALMLTPEAWLISLSIMAGLLASALTAWETDAPPITWVTLLLVTGSTLCVLSTPINPSHPASLILPLACLDTVHFALVFLLARTGDLRAASHGSLLTGTLRQTIRWASLWAIVCSVLQWIGVAALLSRGGNAWQVTLLILLSLFLRSGVWPAHTAALILLTRGILPGSIMASAALLPATSHILAQLIPQWNRWGVCLLVMAAVLSLLSALTERDLRRATARWTLAGSAMILAILACSSPADRRAVEGLVVSGVLAASTSCLLLAGLVAVACNHAEISRLRGLAGRAAGIFGWMVLGVLLLSGAPPGAVFASFFSSPSGTPVEVALLLPVTAALTLAVVQKTFLGLPRPSDPVATDDPLTIRISGRQRLALLLLLSVSVAAALAPATLFQAPSTQVPTPR